MEQLEPILRYKFWISFGAAILLPAIGWYMATGSMAVEVNKRWTTVENSFNSKVLKESEIAKAPNNNYIEGIKTINASHAKDLEQAKADLSNAQKQYMVWPAIVSETMANAGYRQPPPDPDGRFKYGNVYRQELERVRKIVNPFDEKTKEGLVYAPEGILPKAADDNWTTYGPPADRMWDAQEDIWLLTSIMQAIAAVNKDATSIIDAPVKAIQDISLRGGSKVAPPPAQGAEGEGGRPKISARAYTSTAMNPGNASFNPADEFGPEIVVAAAASGGGSDDEPDRKSRNRRNARPTKRAGKKDDASAPTNSMKRYIEEDNAKGFKTRGFYIRVAMDHTFVPELVAQLSNMPWPTEIARVQQSDQVTREFFAGRVESNVATAQANAGQAAAKSPGGNASFARMDFAGIGRREQEVEVEQKEAEEQAKQLLENPKKGAGLSGKAIEKDLVDAALEDPYVGLVVIAGTMTIYNQPTEAPKKAQPTQQQAQPKPADAQQQNKQPSATSPQPKQGGEAPNQGTSPQKQASPPPKQESQQPTQNNPPPKQANPPAAQPKQGGNPAGSQNKQPASEAKTGPNAQPAAESKPQPDAPAKPPSPGDKK